MYKNDNALQKQTKRICDSFLLILSFYLLLLHPIQGPRIPQGRVLQSQIVVRVGKDEVRNAYYENVLERYRLTLDVERPRLQLSRKHAFMSLYHKATILEKNLSEWKLFLIKGTQREQEHSLVGLSPELVGLKNICHCNSDRLVKVSFV